MSSDAASLSAIAKRSSQQELDRLQTIGTLLLAQLKSNAANIIDVNDQESQKNSQQQQQESEEDTSITSIRKCLQWSSVSPRFIYIAASNKIIRSADRGRSWKAVPMPSIFSSGNNNAASSTSTTPTVAPSALPKIIRIASCSTSGAIAFSGTQRCVGISLKVGGPFQMLTQGLNQLLGSSPAMNIVHANNISLNTLFFDSCGLLLFVGSTVTAPNFLCVYSILTATWFPVFSAAVGLSSSSSSSSSSLMLPVSCFKLLRESISQGSVEVAIFFSPSSSSSSSSSGSNANIGTHQPASVIKNKNSKILQKVALHETAVTKSKTQQQPNANPPPSTTTMLVDGVGGFQLYQISRSPVQSSSAVLRKSPVIPHKLGSILNCQEIDPFFSNSSNNNSNVECLPPSFVLRRFRWISRWRPGAAAVAPNINSNKLPAGTKTTQMRTPTSSKKKYDYTIGSIVPSSQLPFVTEFFSSASSSSSSTTTQQSQQDNSPMTLLDNLAEDDPFLVIKTPIVKLKKKIQPKKKPVVKTGNSNSSSSSSSSSDADDDTKSEEKFEYEDTFRGGFFPQTAPRLLACYSTGGRVVDSDATCFLWFWLGEPTDVEENSNNKNDDPNAENNNNQIDQDAGAIYTTVTNISYLPLVQSSTTTTTTTASSATGGGSTVLSSSSSFSLNTQGSLLGVLDHGRSWLRCGISGAATSYDGGRAWSEPQMSCIAACCTLDRQSHLVVASRPGFALLPELEQSAINSNVNSTKSAILSTSSGSMSALLPPRGSTTSNNNNNAAAVSGINLKKWNLFTIPASLGCSVMSDVCVLE